MPPIAESAVVDLRRQVADAEAEAHEARRVAEDTLERLRAQGRNPLTDPTAFAESDECFARAERLAARAAELRGRLDRAVGEIVGSGTSRLGMPPLRASDDDLRALHAATLQRHVERRAVTTVEAPMADVGDFVLDEVFPFLRDTVRIASLLPIRDTDQGTVHIFRGNVAADAAATVAEGATKPESAPTWEQVDIPIRKVAHFVEVTDEVVADFNGFLSVVQTELLAGLIAEENTQLLTGDGTGTNISGLNTEAGQTVTRDTTGGEPRLDALHRGITACRTGSAFVEPDVVVLHPNDWEDVRLQKDSNGAYLHGNPVGPDDPRVFGVPVVTTTRQPEGDALVANLTVSCRLYVRLAPVVEVAPQSGAEFKANTTLIRAEERVGLAVVRPQAIVKVTSL